MKQNSLVFLTDCNQPINRWFSTPSPYSFIWAKDVIENEIRKRGNDIILLDPFVGTGTSLLAADECNVASYGIEAQPYFARIARIKTRWDCNLEKFEFLIKKVYENSKSYNRLTDEYPELIYKCFPEDKLIQLECLKKSWQTIDDESAESELVWLCITCILRVISQEGTFHSQQIIPDNNKKNASVVYETFENQSKIMIDDVSHYQKFFHKPRSKVICASTLFTKDVPEDIADILITSPPYLINYDYAETTSLEMSFWGKITNWNDLQDKARKNLIRACSKHVTFATQSLEEILEETELQPILSELKKVTQKLKVEREKSWGDHYHLMVAGYFSDMSKAFKNIRRMCKDRATLYFVICDSAFYDVYIPVAKWIGILAEASGFRSYQFKKIRVRKQKSWKRKRSIRLPEGILRIEG